MARIGIIGWIVLGGIALRLAHYLLGHTIWYDESVLLFNILDKDYWRLLGPLDHDVAAPPLYLWGLRSMALFLPDSPFVWRFPSLVAGCLLLAVMADLARRTLPLVPAAVLTALVALSDAHVLLGDCVKPYILDALLAACLLDAYLLTARWTPTRRVLLFAVLAPVLLCLSYVSLFLDAGLMLALLSTFWRKGEAGPWLAWLGMGAGLLAVLLVLKTGPIAAQRTPKIVAEWSNKFVDLSAPARVPGWVAGNTFLVFHYCYNPVGGALLLLAVAGAWRAVRQGRGDWACVALAPVLAVLAAAFARAYPYSNNRLIFFLAPGIGLMAGLGLAACLEALRARPRLAALLVVVLLLPEACLSAYRLVRPWDKPDSKGVAAFVEARRLPGDDVASDEGGYAYFFYPRLRPLAVAARGEADRVWAVMDFYTPEHRRAYVRSQLAEDDWELAQETRFHQATAFLFVRRAKATVSR